MGLPQGDGGFDYFSLLGVDRDNPSDRQIDAAVLERAKALRPWQNSPKHGEEAVRLLTSLHRVANILKNPNRRKAYETELQRAIKGEELDPLDSFREMVQTALADGTIDQQTKADLFQYASEKKISQAEAGRIIHEVMESSPEAASEHTGADTLSHMRTGPEGFRSGLEFLVNQGRLTQARAQKAVDSASKFGLDKAQAEAILDEVRKDRFRGMIERVARDGVINNNQARLLMRKAETLGLTSEVAYAVIEPFTFTSASEEELEKALEAQASTFEAGDIDRLVESVVVSADAFGDITSPMEDESSNRTRGKRTSLAPFFRTGAVVTAVGAMLAAGFLFGLPALQGRNDPVVETPPVAQVATPEPTPAGPQPIRPLNPDPKDGLIAVAATQPGDPPAFRMKIHEVTCGEYQQFLKRTLYPGLPLNWKMDLSFPPGHENRPVVGITWRDAREYCNWIARGLGVPRGNVRMPTRSEVARVMREPNGWGVAPDQAVQWKPEVPATPAVLADVKQSVKDLFFFDDGQIYGLVGNAAEWSSESEGDRRYIFGGIDAFSEGAYDPREPRLADPGKKAPNIGFRYVVLDTPPR